MRALALDGAVDPQLWTNRPLDFTRDQAIGYERELQAFFAWCARTRCAFGKGHPDRAHDKLLASLRTRPLRVAHREPVTTAVAANPAGVSAHRSLDAELAGTAPRVGRAVAWTPGFSPAPCASWPKSTSGLHSPWRHTPKGWLVTPPPSPTVHGRSPVGAGALASSPS